MIKPIFDSALASFLLVSLPALILGVSVSVLFFESSLTFPQILAFWGVAGSVSMFLAQTSMIRKATR